MKEKNTGKKLRKALIYILTTDHSDRWIGERVGLHHNTVKKRRTVSIHKGLSLEKVKDLDDKELQDLFIKKRGKTKQLRQPDFEYIQKELKHKGVTKMLLWREYVAEDPSTAYSYSQFTDECRKYIKSLDVTMRHTHFAGEQIQVDFAGKTIPYYDDALKQMMACQIFVGMLPCSNYTFVWACRSQKVPDFIDAHIRMFEYFGGSASTLVPDNLKSAVIKPGIIPELNRTYDNMAEHYGTIAAPARPLKPKDKAAVELTVSLVTRWILARFRHRQFFSLDEVNKAIAPLLEELNNRPFKRLPGCRRSQFEELEKHMLNPLPQTPFVYGEWTNCLKVGADYHVYVDGHAYSVPFNLVTQSVEARATAHTVEIYHLSKRVAVHQRSFAKGQATTVAAHRHPRHQAFAERYLEDYLQWGLSIGESATKVVKSQFHGKPEHSLAGARACDQLKKLCRQYGEERFEDACAHACQLQSLIVKTIRSILHSKVDLVVDVPKASTLPKHNNIRGADYYAGGAV